MSRNIGSTRVALDSLGCKLNQAEVELLARQFAEVGCTLVSPGDEADIYVLNTCTVTHIADRKSRHLLGIARRRNPAARLVVTGCYAERAPEEIADVDGVDMVIGNMQKHCLVQLLTDAGYLFKTDGCDSEVHRDMDNRTRAMVKIQEGCTNFCSYCIVPLVRRGENSMPVNHVVAGVTQRVADGHKEVVLTGTKIGSYNYNGTNLAALLRNVLADTGVFRLRLSSLQPQEISAELLLLWNDSRLCPHFHLSLQSGSDSVLKRMNRQYSAYEFQQSVSLIRKNVPEAAITTDVIVGFPGETDAEFEENYNFCRQMQFARIHVFPYSQREGTEAAKMPLMVADKVKKQRSQKMLDLAKESDYNFRQKFSGKTMTVLWEKKNESNVWSGLTGNYIRIYKKSNEDLANQATPVKLP